MIDMNLEVIFTDAGVKIGDKFYSSVFGDLYYDSIEYDYIGNARLCFRAEPVTESTSKNLIKVIGYNTRGNVYTVRDGDFAHSTVTDNITLFPSREQSNWDKWLEETKNRTEN